jgi:glutathione S-transferase
MVRLHYHPGNASFAPHVLLNEIGEPFELVFVDRAAQAHKSPAYLKLNPNGLIPVFVDGDLVLYEAAAICLHLVDTHPECGLAPDLGSVERAHFYKWMIWLTNTLQPTLMNYFYPDRMLLDGTAAGAAEVRARAEARTIEFLAQIDAQLATHKDAWLLGDRYGAVDPFAFMMCRWTRNFATRPARAFPHIGPYLQRVYERPAVQRTFTTEQLPLPPY